eukprot:COSAG01_NODE_4276_length_5188_cov_3.459422_1_plen_149_part_10
MMLRLNGPQISQPCTWSLVLELCRMYAAHPQPVAHEGAFESTQHVLTALGGQLPTALLPLAIDTLMRFTDDDDGRRQPPAARQIDYRSAAADDDDPNASVSSIEGCGGGSRSGSKAKNGRGRPAKKHRAPAAADDDDQDVEDDEEEEDE